MINLVPESEPHPSKVAVFSTDDIPRGKPDAACGGVPFVVEVEGEVMRVTVSEFVKPGMVVVMDEALLTGAADRWQESIVARELEASALRRARDARLAARLPAVPHEGGNET